MIATYVIYLQQKRGLSLTQVAFMDSTFWIVMAFSEVPTGIVADRFSRKSSLIIGTILSCMGFLSFGLAPSFILLMLANTIWAIGNSFQSGANEALLYESLQIIGRGKEYTKITGRVLAIRRGMVVVSIIGGLLASIDLVLPFLVGALFQGAVLIILFTLKEPKIERKETENTRMRYDEMVRQSVKVIRAHPRLRFAVLYLTVIPIAWFGMGVLFLQPIAISLGVPIALIGVVVMMVNGASMAGSILADRTEKHFGKKRILYSVPVLLIICLIFIGAIQTVLVLLIVAVLCFLAVLTEPLVKDIIQNEVPDEIRATVLSMQSLLSTLFIAIMEPILGFIADHFGLSGTYYTLAGLFGIFCILLFWKRWWLDSNSILSRDLVTPNQTYLLPTALSDGCDVVITYKSTPLSKGEE